MSGTDAPAARDAAWVVLETPLRPVELSAFCRKLETLYRINPFLEFESWQLSADGELRAGLRNHSNDRAMALEGRLVLDSDLAWHIEFASGPKVRTRFEVGPSAAGSQLTITDEYRSAGPSVFPEEVDRSLHAWGVAIREHLERDRRWGWLPLYRAFIHRVWLPMKPGARRITFLVLVIGLADLALVALGLALYWLETRR